MVAELSLLTAMGGTGRSAMDVLQREAENSARHGNVGEAPLGRIHHSTSGEQRIPGRPRAGDAVAYATFARDTQSRAKSMNCRMASPFGKERFGIV
jgi:hypothetical protein